MRQLFKLLLISGILIGCKTTGDRVSDSGVSAKKTKIVANGKASGPYLKEEEIRKIISENFSGDAAAKMICTACYESRWGQNSYMNNTNGTTDIGLFQVNSVHWGKDYCVPKAERANARAYLSIPANNAKCAAAIFERQGIKAWYGYSKHKNTCDKYVSGDLTVTDKKGKWLFCPYPEGGLKKLSLNGEELEVSDYEGLPKFYDMTESEVEKVQNYFYSLWERLWQTESTNEE